MSKILLYYPVTESVYLDYLVSQEWQQAIYGGMYQFDKLIITDTEFIKKDPDKKETILRIPEWTLCKSQNAAIDYADRNGYDYLWFLDSGAIILADPVLPQDYYTAAMVYMTDAGELQRRSFGSFPYRWKISSWHLMHRKCYGYRYCEDFTGLHFTDCDFVFNILNPVGVGGDEATPNRCVHAYHPQRTSVEDYHKSLRLFAKRSLFVNGKAKMLEMVKGFAGYKEVLKDIL